MTKWVEREDRVTDGFTVTPSAQSLTVGSSLLSGGGWKAPQYGYSDIYLALFMLDLKNHYVEY